MSSKPRRPRITAYMDSELYERFFNAIWWQRLRLSHVVEEMVKTWVEKQEAKEWHYTGEDDKHRVKAAGEPYPLRPLPTLPTGRPEGT